MRPRFDTTQMVAMQSDMGRCIDVRTGNGGITIYHISCTGGLMQRMRWTGYNVQRNGDNKIREIQWNPTILA